MRFEVNKNSVKVTSVDVYGSELEYFINATKLFCVTQFPDLDSWPSKKEFSFLAYALICYSNGIYKLTSKEAVAIMQEYDDKLNSAKNVRARLERLKEKLWFKKERGNYIPLPRFKELASKNKTDFNMSIKKENK